MQDVSYIMDMLDWGMSPEVQSKGRELAKSVEEVTPFLQPVTPKHNKDVWRNCAEILAERSDVELQPHLVALLEWLQDMNWPGADCVLERLCAYTETPEFRWAILRCMNCAKETGDQVWLHNLLRVRKNHALNDE